MKDVFITSDNVLSPIAGNTAANFAQLKRSISAVQLQEDGSMSDVPFMASLFAHDKPILKEYPDKPYTKFERLLINSISDALQKENINSRDKKTVLIISTTKGNISLLETETYSKELENRISLNTSAKLVADYFHFANKPIVISNACISGLLALITGMRLLQSGQYENAVIAGADVISKFVLSGFQSFQAISSDRCKPFDAARNGINLGEAAGTVVLSSNKKLDRGFQLLSGSVSNDANHISGPSRTGIELNMAITKVMKDANLSAKEIDFISAHGTATIFNDEMEANAINLANLQHVPVNSLKGYFGHTLGAAGIIESIISMQSLKEDILLPTIGFQNIGVTMPINVCGSLYKASLKNCLKTASGFGGCNAAVILNKQ